MLKLSLIYTNSITLIGYLEDAETLEHAMELIELRGMGPQGFVSQLLVKPVACFTGPVTVKVEPTATVTKLGEDDDRELKRIYEGGCQAAMQKRSGLALPTLQMPSRLV